MEEDHQRQAAKEHAIVAEASGGELCFRSLRESDLPQVEVWLSHPHVLAWWGQPLDREGVRAKYLPCIEGKEPVHLFVIELRGEPLGFFQWYRWRSYPEHAARLGADPSSAGLDLAIGDPGHVGRGLGTRVLRAVVKQVIFADSRDH